MERTVICDLATKCGKSCPHNKKHPYTPSCELLCSQWGKPECKPVEAA